MGLLTVTYGGIRIPVKITKLNRNLMPPITNNTQTIGNSDGGSFSSSRYGENTITFDYMIDNRMAKDLSEFLVETAGIIHSKELKQLIFSDEPDLYYEAILSGEQTLNEEYLNSTGTLTFIEPNGLAHSTVEKTFSAVSKQYGVLKQPL